MSWIKVFLFITYLIVISFSILEIIFRFLPVSDSLKLQGGTENNPIIYYKPNRVVTHQFGGSFKKIRKKKVNNAGYFSDVDYAPNEGDVVVIGDSYVEALQVKNDQTFHSKIKSKKVYSIGISGSSLAQYIAFIRYAEKKYNPNEYYILIIGNDFDESLMKYKKVEGMHYFDDKGMLKLLPIKENKLKKILRESAFLRYMHLDLKIQHLIKSLMSSESGGNYRSYTNPKSEMIEDGRKVINDFFKLIGESIGEKKLTLVIDGDRRGIYKNKAKRDVHKFDNIMFNYFIDKARNFGINIIDLQEVFYKDWIKNNKKFNDDNDYHWNEYGHEVVSNVINKTYAN